MANLWGNRVLIQFDQEDEEEDEDEDQIGKLKSQGKGFCNIFELINYPKVDMYVYLLPSITAIQSIKKF